MNAASISVRCLLTASLLIGFASPGAAKHFKPIFSDSFVHVFVDTDSIVTEGRTRSVVARTMFAAPQYSLGVLYDGMIAWVNFDCAARKYGLKRSALTNNQKVVGVKPDPEMPPVLSIDSDNSNVTYGSMRHNQEMAALDSRNKHVLAIKTLSDIVCEQ
jgi:hypothetical protein